MLSTGDLLWWHDLISLHFVLSIEYNCGHTKLVELPSVTVTVVLITFVTVFAIYWRQLWWHVFCLMFYFLFNQGRSYSVLNTVLSWCPGCGVQTVRCYSDLNWLRCLCHTRPPQVRSTATMFTKCGLYWKVNNAISIHSSSNSIYRRYSCFHEFAKNIIIIINVVLSTEDSYGY